MVGDQTSVMVRDVLSVVLLAELKALPHSAIKLPH